MTKRISTLEPEETVTIPRRSFDAMFEMLEQMGEKIDSLEAKLAKLTGTEKKDDVLLSVEQAAEYCGRTRQTLAKWALQKKIHKVRRGCRTGYLTSELDKVKPC